MKNFTLCTPTKIIFGRAVENKLGKEAANYGKKVLVIHGSDRVKTTGLLDKLYNSLKEEDITPFTLGGVLPNPRLNLVYEGIKICKEHNIDLLLAVGGGSVTDTAKAIALGAKYEGDVWDFYTRKTTPNTALPVGVVVTIAASGSEYSNDTVITNEKTGTKQALGSQLVRPAFALLNPELTMTLPSYQTACGCADIMMHAIERYFTSLKNVELTDRLIEGLLLTMIANSPRVLADLSDYNSRAEIMWASSLAHNGLLGTGRIGDFSSHLLGHELSAKFDTEHGASLTIVFPAWMKYVYKNDIPLFAKFAVRVMGIEYNYDNPEETALLGIEKIKSFFNELGLPTSLSEIDVKEEDIEEMVQKCMRHGTVGNFVKLGEADIRAIYNLALSDD
jgi:hypothetical protein